MSSSLDSFEVAPALGSKVDLVRPIDQTATRVAVDVPTGVFARSTWQRRYAATLRVSDFFVVSAAVLLSQFVRFGPTWTPTGYPHYYVTTYSALFIAAWLCALVAFRTRSPRLIGTGLEEYRRVVTASLSTFGVIAIVSLLLKLDIARGYLALALPVGAIGLVLTRWAWHRQIISKRSKGHCQTAVLAFGELDAVEHLVEELTQDPTEGYQVVGIAVPGYGPSRGEHLTIGGHAIPVVGGEAEMLRAIRTYGADTVAIAGTEHFGVRGIRRLIWDLEPMGVDLVVSTGVMDVALSRLVMRPTAGIPLLQIEAPQYRGSKKLQKRAFDLCFATAVLVVTSPLLLAISIAIKLDSRGSVFYTSERIGIDGRPFSMVKFRTMVQDVDRQLVSLLASNESDGVLFKMKEDPRITRVGSFLRRYSLDELPQFINVLLDDMSVVGPRPPLRREVESYDCEVLRRLLVKPGITGLWQVSGRSDLSWNDAVRLDLSYVDNWSTVGDLLLIAKTVGAVVQKKGAY
jgi:exopolysaccharide biosynthesis polyprenyl glycosylphosphotransferase